MSQPVPYDRLSDLELYATQNPAEPYNAAQHDAEFDAIEQTLDETLRNVALVQRDDGLLKNGTVHPNSLSSATRLLIGGWNPRGSWVTATLYASRDFIENGGLGYVAVTTHTSSTFATDLAAGKWLQVDVNSAALLSDTGGPTVNDAQVLVTLDATGSVATTQDQVNAERVSVFRFMTPSQIADVRAKTFLVDVTDALQNAITTILGQTGNDLEWPDGGYRIGDSLFVQQIVGTRMFGQSRSGVEMRQFADNTPICTLTHCDSAIFEIDHFTLGWANQQTASDTSAIAIYFAGTTGTPQNGFHNFDIHHCTFNKGYRSIASNSGIQLAVWGWDINHIYHGATMVGACVHIIPSPSIGIPNCNLKHMYVRADAATETLLNLAGIGALAIENIEFNNGTIGGAGNPSQHILLTNCGSVTMDSCREEAVTINVDGGRIWNFASSFVTIKGAEFGTINVNDAMLGVAIQADTNSKVSVDNMNVSKGTIGAGSAIAMFNGSGFGELSNVRWVGSAGNYILYPGGNADEVRVRKTISADNGDAAKTLVVGTDVETQVWNTPISQDRAVTLSTTVTPNPGAKFRIVRTASATGAFNLNVGTGPLKAMGTAGSFCEVQYNGATAAWMLTAYGTL